MKHLQQALNCFLLFTVHRVCSEDERAKNELRFT